MNKQMNHGCTHSLSQSQLARIRRLYSSIGEPLPVDIILDLCRCLPKALAAAQPAAPHKPKPFGRH